MADHELKTVPPFFDDVLHDRKRFEIRKDDRGYALGDRLILREWMPELRRMGIHQPGFYTGRFMVMRVSYLVRGKPFLPEDTVVMGVEEGSLAGIDCKKYDIGRAAGQSSTAAAKEKP